MQSPWGAEYRTPSGAFGDLRAERSTSAPPPETSFLFGRKEGLVAPAASRLGGFEAPLDNKWGSPFNNGIHSGSEIDTLFLDTRSSRESTNASISARKQPPPGFATNFVKRDDLPSSVPGHLDFGSGSAQFGSLDAVERRSIGENLIRSHSAAPSLDGRVSMGPPPGLANSDTPLVSNRTQEDYLEPAMDSSRIVQMGQRRPASTGVIRGSLTSSTTVLDSLGLGSSNGGAVRPAAKTLMDLIQEDFPPESPMDNNGYNSEFPNRDEVYLERPRTTSPLSRHTLDRYDERGRRKGHVGLSEALDRLHVNPTDSYGALDRQRLSPQYVAVDTGRTACADRQPASSFYAPVAQPTRPRPQTIHQQAQLDQQHRYAGQSPQLQQHLQAHILPTGQTVYVNATPAQYGYTTVQYHTQTQQPHLLHQVQNGVSPHGEQFLSVVPIQASGAPVQSLGSNGTYAYFQHDGLHVCPQTYTILNAHGPGGVPVTVARVGGNGRADSSRQQQSSGRSKEKNGRRRGGSGKRGGESKHQPNSTCSPLLEEFKNKKNRDWTILNIKGFVVEFCQDQNGSRFIQQRLEVGNTVEKEVVMMEVLPAVRRLRNDVFGNYVVQKLLDFGTSGMKEDIRETLQGEMLQLSLQMYGCRVVQKALETLDDADLPKLLTEFHNNVLSCIHDQNGNHVIQKCIEVMSSKARTARDSGDAAQADFFNEQIDFIVEDILGNVQSLSCHPYGCRVLQRILEHCPEPKKKKALDEISKCHKTLLDDQYGNYVIQHVLQFGRTSDRDSLLQLVVANGLLTLSRQKFASNVVEKLLKYGSQEQRNRIVREMLKNVDDRSGKEVPGGVDGTSVVLLMVRDAYANYVVQTTLDVITEGEEKLLLMRELNSHSAELKNYTFAKHIVTKLGA